MVSVYHRGCRFPSFFASFYQPLRKRHIPSPGTLDQRLFRECTKPIYREPKLSRAEKYLISQAEIQKRSEQNPYRNFLIRRAKTDFYDKAEGQMILIFQPLYSFPWELRPFLNKLHENGLRFRRFPMSVLKEAAKGTKWEVFAHTVLKEPIPNLYLFGDADPSLCATALAITGRAHFFVLLGGIIQHRIMTRDEVKAYASLGDLPTLHAELLGNLQHSTSEMARLLNHHGGDLATLLKHYSKSDNDCSDSSSSDSSDSSDEDS